MYEQEKRGWFGRGGGERFARRMRDGGDEAPFHGGHGRHERGHGHGHGGHGHGGHRRHGGGLGRFFAHGDLRLVVLSLIAEKPSHGYELIKSIEDRVGGAYSPSPGVIYPTLTLLEELGYVSVSTAEGSKKLYAITAEGTDFLKANRKTLEALDARMTDAGRSHRSGAAPQIVRAMENLKTALRLKATNGPLTPDQIEAVATAIDAAALAVEKA